MSIPDVSNGEPCVPDERQLGREIDRHTYHEIADAASVKATELPYDTGMDRTQSLRLLQGGLLLSYLRARRKKLRFARAVRGEKDLERKLAVRGENDPNDIFMERALDPAKVEACLQESWHLTAKSRRQSEAGTSLPSQDNNRKLAPHLPNRQEAELEPEREPETRALRRQEEPELEAS
ncbi:uncharacterized protein PAC_05586 [Phialocephala subalpina]|uniref:Uncharacterized protein n=1 Tax=Phialocephala subalpina TaxID=576137 RepID=A0A1L7WSF4_9HELO|nr:uncharacterized protein PAC_05586 [Phialocephala subalpina]